MKRLLVLCGGQSPEHSISIRSCKNVLAALNRQKYSVTLIGITPQGKWVLLDENELGEEVRINGKHVEIRPGNRDSLWCIGQSLGYFDAVFPVLHGPNGEDGSIQGLLQLLAIPFVGCGLGASAACMDKDVTKRLLRDAGVGVADWVTLCSKEGTSFDQVKTRFGMPVYVKPANMGSSIGVHKVTNESEWREALREAFSFDDKVLVEKAIKGREMECAVMGNKHISTSGVGEVLSDSFYSYEEKYADTSHADVIIPAQVDKEHLISLQQTAQKSYKALGCEGMARVDMFLTDQGEVFVNEINTLPGFTDISMYPQLWQAEGMSYADLLDELIQLAMMRRPKILI